MTNGELFTNEFISYLNDFYTCISEMITKFLEEYAIIEKQKNEVEK